MKYALTHRFGRRLRLVVQLSFLILFMALILVGRVQLWMPVFLGGVVASLIFSRFYCGYLCQMGTLFRAVNRLKAWLRIPQFAPPAFLQRRPVRFAMIIVTLGVMAAMQRAQLGPEPLIWITGLSVVVTLFFHESFWHNHLCPYGAVLSLTTRAAPIRMRIDEERCIACGICERVCPTHTIARVADKKRRVLNVDCLVCGECRAVCPPNVIRYSR